MANDHDVTDTPVQTPGLYLLIAFCLTAYRIIYTIDHSLLHIGALPELPAEFQ